MQALSASSSLWSNFYKPKLKKEGRKMLVWMLNVAWWCPNKIYTNIVIYQLKLAYFGRMVPARFYTLIERDFPKLSWWIAVVFLLTHVLRKLRQDSQPDFFYESLLLCICYHYFTLHSIDKFANVNSFADKNVGTIPSRVKLSWDIESCRPIYYTISYIDIK